MKIAYSKSRAVGLISGIVITPSSEDPAFPATNLLLGQPSKVYRSVAAAAPIATQTLNIAVPAGVTSCLGIFGCNATSIAYAIKDTTETTTYFSGTLDTTPASPTRTFNRAWLDWTDNGFALHIIFTLTAPSTATYHEVGEIVVCESVTLPDPLKGLFESQESFQVIQQKAGGGLYIHDGAIPRTFDLSFILVRETEYRDLKELHKVMGMKPMAMLLSETQGDFEYCGYFHIQNPGPKAVHEYATKSMVTMSLREAI